ncbi:MAG: DUF418 domain-containing protein [Rubrobacter sp.]|nr:DUF418 domain-containing protein [Rubrobacter sp.]
MAPRGRQRLYGVDAARTMAIAGMVMVHFGPFEAPDTFTGDLYSLSSGRASVLFALLAGVSVSLLAAARPAPKVPATEQSDNADANTTASTPSTVTNTARVRLIVRALPLLPLGLYLQTLDHNALVILQYYSLYFVLAALMLGLRSEHLLNAAGVVLIFGPLLYLLTATSSPGWFSQLPATLTDEPSRIALELLLTGAYPLLTWAAPVVFGMWLGRRDLQATRLKFSLLVGGVVVTAAAASASVLASTPPLDPESQAWSFLLSSEPHSQAFIWMAGATGSACAVLGLLLLAADVAPRLMWPLAATGQLALTIYVGHIVAMHLTGDLLEREQIAEAAITVAVFMAAAVALSVAYRAVFGQGPLEALLGLPYKAVLATHRKVAVKKQDRDGPL